MAEQTGKFLTELPELTTPIEDDLMYIVDDDTSKRITLKNLKSVVGGEDVTGTASGAVVTFIDGGDDKPLKECEVSIEATQSGSGTPSPSNVRPIVGRSEVNVSVEGKNKVPKGENRTSSDITFTVQDNGEVVITGTASATAFWGVKFTIPKGTYTMTGCPSGGSANSYYIDVRDAVGGSGISGISADMGNGSTFTLTDELTAYLNIRVASGYSAPSGGLTLSPMIRLSTAPEGFEPYITPEVTTISLGRIVYGGTLDVVRGVLTVTKRIVTEDDFTIMGGGTSGGGLNYFQIPSTDAQATSGEAISNMLVQNQSGWGSNIPCFTTNTGSAPTIYPVRVYAESTSLANFKSEYEGLQIVYTLATPQTITLTPTEVQTILGYNNISADSGDVSVVYVRDLNITINDLINRVTALENE